jgi:hypothetical protein
MTDKYEEKYLKYNQKYLELKNQIGGITEIAPEAEKAAAEKASAEKKAAGIIAPAAINAAAKHAAEAAKAQAEAESHAEAEALYRSYKLTELPDGTTFKCNKQELKHGPKTGVIVGKTNETNNLHEIIYKVVFSGEDTIKTLKRSEITPTGIAGLAAAADLAKKNTVIGAKVIGKYGSIGVVKAASAAVSAANTAVDTYKKVSPKVYQGAISAASKTVYAASAAAEAAKNTYKRFSPKIAANLKQGATAVAAAASSAASAAASAAKKTPGIFESIGNAFTNKTTAAPASPVASEPSSPVASPVAQEPSGDLNTKLKSILDASEY